MSEHLIKRLRESEAELLVVASRCEAADLPGSARRLRQVAAICARDANELQKEHDESIAGPVEMEVEP